MKNKQSQIIHDFNANVVKPMPNETYESPNTPGFGNAHNAHQSPIAQLDGNFSPQNPVRRKKNKNRNPQTPNTFKVAIVNARSITNKITDLGNLARNHETSIVLISETWETDRHGPHLKALQGMNDFDWYSEPRKGKRGGGVAMLLNRSFGNSVAFDVPNASNCEVLWRLITPSYDEDLRILVCAFYVPPAESHDEVKKVREALHTHLADGVALAMSKHKNIEVVLGGDFNRVDLTDVLTLTNLKQVVDKPTRQGVTLDILITSLMSNSCNVYPPLMPDPGTPSRRSDHDTPVVELRFPNVKKQFFTIRSRKINDGSKAKLKRLADAMPLTLEDPRGDPTASVGQLEAWISMLVQSCFPWTKRRVREGDPLYFDEVLVKMCKAKSDEYKRNGNSSRFRELKAKFRSERKRRQKRFFENVLDAAGVRPEDWHSTMRTLMTADCKRVKKQSPIIPQHSGLSDQEKAEDAVDHIASITEGYIPIDVEDINEKYPGINAADFTVTEEEVLKEINDMKIPKGLHPEDLPEKTLKCLANQLARPLAEIFTEIIRRSKWPAHWKQELTTMIAKKPVLNSIRDLRPIAITPLLSKLLERICKKRINRDISKQTNINQFGGQPGIGVDHYLIALTSDIAITHDSRARSVLLAFDYSQAFNSLSHPQVVHAAAALGLNHTMTRLVASYLEGRTTAIKWNDARSGVRPALGGSGQGTVLSVDLFRIAVNGLLSSLENEIQHWEAGWPVQSQCKLYVDDLSLLIVVPDHETFEDFDGQIQLIETGRIGAYLKALETFSLTQGMRLNQSKTAAIVFNHGRRELKFDHERLAFSNGVVIEPGNELRILGIPIDDTLSWDGYAKERRTKGMQAIWNLRKLKRNGVGGKHLRQAFMSYVRPKSDYCLAPLITMLNNGQREYIEGVQLSATKVILGTAKYPRHGDGSVNLEYICADARNLTLGLRSIISRAWERYYSYSVDMEVKAQLRRFFQCANIRTIIGRETRYRPIHYVEYRLDKAKRCPAIDLIRRLNEGRINQRLGGVLRLHHESVVPHSPARGGMIFPI